MSKLLWDQLGERKFEVGVSKGVLYKKLLTDPYGKGVPWNGLTNVEESPEGAEVTDLYADGIKYAQLRSAENYKTSIEAYMYPDEFAACDGSAEPVPGLRIGQQPREPFGFCYRTEVGDDQTDAGMGDYKLHLIYGCSAAPSTRAHGTINDSPEAEAMSWDVSTTPVPVTGYKPTASMEIYSAKFDAAKMKALEDILYGVDAAEAVGEEGQPGYVPAVVAKVARMPLPDEIITLLGTGA